MRTVGKIANKYGLKTDEYGKWFMDKARNSSKEVENFRYNEKGLRAIEECLEKDKPTDITSYMMTDILQLQH